MKGDENIHNKNGEHPKLKHFNKAHKISLFNFHLEKDY